MSEPAAKWSDAAPLVGGHPTVLTIGPWCVTSSGVLPGLEPPMAMQISRAEQDHHAMLRRRSYELAVQRGHMRRG